MDQFDAFFFKQIQILNEGCLNHFYYIVFGGFSYYDMKISDLIEEKNLMCISLHIGTKVIKEVNYPAIWYFKTTIKIIFKRRTNDNLSFS